MTITKKSNIIGNIPSFNIITSTSSYKFFTKYAIKTYKRNYRMSKKDDFVEKMILQIKHTLYFRLHLVGHFYSQKYLDDWKTIARNKHNVVFYVYVTHNDKSGLDYSNLPDNFLIINVDDIITDYAKNIVYTKDNLDTEICPKVLNKVKCQICMSCLHKKMVVYDYPWY